MKHIAKTLAAILGSNLLSVGFLATQSTGTRTISNAPAKDGYKSVPLGRSGLWAVPKPAKSGRELVTEHNFCCIRKPCAPKL